MIVSGYEISPYNSTHMQQVANLLQHLTGDTLEQNQDYLKWKYHDNPYAERPLGIVAMHDGKVIGFRGYFATKWQIPLKNYQTNILSPGDTCVHPDHRRKGLSLAMGYRAMAEYASEYKIFLNLSSGKASLPGYLRMGFVPLQEKTYMTRADLFGLVKLVLSKIGVVAFSKRMIDFGEFDDILIENSPKPQDMAALTSKQDLVYPKLTLLKNEMFFRWRFNNKRRKYVFFYYKDKQLIKGYVVIRISSFTRYGYIIDYSRKDKMAVEKILQYIIKMKYFDVLLIYNSSICAAFLPMFKVLGFRVSSLTRLKKRMARFKRPLFVRPVKKNPLKSDWLIEGLDIRKIENWEIKEICSDGV